MSTKDSDFYRTLTLVLAALGVFFVIIIVAALLITDSDSVKPPVDARIEAKTNSLIAQVGEVNTDPSAAAASAAPAGGAFDAGSAYTSKCAACHATGAAGAPKVGDKAAWKTRIAAGDSSLYKNAINGKGGMPAKGGHASMSDDDIIAIVDHMVSKSK